MNLLKILEPLGELFTITGHDWNFNLDACLTEPTCPTAVIAPEGWHIARYRVDCDTIEESTEKAVRLIIAEIIDRKIVGPSCPFSNPDDEEFEKWLRARAAGSDEPLGLPPGRHMPEFFGLMVDAFLSENKERLDAILKKGSRYGSSYIVARLRYMLPDGIRLDDDRARAYVDKKLESMRGDK